MGSISKKITTIFGGDKALWAVIILILLYSLVVVYSSSVSLAYVNGLETNYYYYKHMSYSLLGLLVTFVVHKIDYRLFKRYNGWIFLAGLILVIMLFFVGVTINGERRWMDVPFMNLTFMPYDFMKIGLILVLVTQLAKRQSVISNLMIIPPLNRWGVNYDRNINVLIYTTIPLLLPIVLTVMFIMPKSLSTAMLISISSFIILIIGGIRKREVYRMVMLAVCVFLFVVVLMVLTGNERVFVWWKRIFAVFENVSLLDMDVNKMDGSQIQVYQSRVAIAAGEIFGKGPGNSIQRSNMPLAFSDYVFAFIVEEHGLLGAIFVMLLYLCILFRGMAIFKKCDSHFSRLLVAGICVSITLQAFLHICVSVGLMFVTGQTLPIISKGGSSVVFTCAMFGIVLSVSRAMDEKRRMLQEMEDREFIERENLILIDDTSIVFDENGDNRGGTKGDYDSRFSEEKILKDNGVNWEYNQEESENNS